VACFVLKKVGLSFVLGYLIIEPQKAQKNHKSEKYKEGFCFLLCLLWFNLFLSTSFLNW
jgi:hypothetical protein